MQFTSLELYTMTKLNCGSADLSMLDDLFSSLADELDKYHGLNRDDLIREEANELNELLDKLYSCATEAITKEAKKQWEKHERNKSKRIRKYMDEQFTETENSYPYTNFLDSHLGNDLDQTIDWGASVENNAENLIEYWLENYDYKYSNK